MLILVANLGSTSFKFKLLDMEQNGHIRKVEKAMKDALAAMTRQGMTALAYPTLRRKPARIGEPQGGSNCQLSPTTGLPAISVPAGFTADGLPIGVDLLGLPFSEAALLKAAYAYERSVAPRRPPSTTPSLIP